MKCFCIIEFFRWMEMKFVYVNVVLFLWFWFRKLVLLVELSCCNNFVYEKCVDDCKLVVGLLKGGYC